jgi:hypothetical protein
MLRLAPYFLVTREKLWPAKGQKAGLPGEARRAMTDQESSSTASAISRPMGMFWGH